MNPKTLKYSEIFSFLAFIFVIFFMLMRVDLLRTEQKLSETEEKAEQVSSLQDSLAQASRQIAQLEQELEQAKAQAKSREDEIARLEQELKKAKKAATEVPDNPPIVILSEEKQTYRFDAGSAKISEDFKKGLQQEIIPFLEEQIDACNCDAIEVVGHTDTVPVGSGRSNLDKELIAAFREEKMPNLKPGSNVDLGMMRALSIIRYLKQVQQQQGKLTEIDYFIPYSAGQMLKPDYTLDTSNKGTDDKSRRRIEMRLLKSTAWDDQVGSGQQ